MAAMDSAAYFLLPPSERAKLEFRYFVENEKIAVNENMKFAGIPKKAPNAAAAKQFLRWFYSPDIQKAILEKSRSLRLSESAFGVAGGFSPLVKVTEKIFSSYYTDLVGAAPPQTSLVAPAPMPAYWERTKSEFVLPWLDGIAGRSPSGSVGEDFIAMFDEFLKANPDLR